jgi:hypothetical protein
MSISRRISRKRHYEKYGRRDATAKFRLHREYDFTIALLVGPAVRRAQIARAILEKREIFT